MEKEDPDGWTEYLIQFGFSQILGLTLTLIDIIIQYSIEYLSDFPKYYTISEKSAIVAKRMWKVSKNDLKKISLNF